MQKQKRCDALWDNNMFTMRKQKPPNGNSAMKRATFFQRSCMMQEMCRHGSEKKKMPCHLAFWAYYYVVISTDISKLTSLPLPCYIRINQCVLTAAPARTLLSQPDLQAPTNLRFISKCYKVETDPVCSSDCVASTDTVKWWPKCSVAAVLFTASRRRAHKKGGTQPTCTTITKYSKFKTISFLQWQKC